MIMISSGALSAGTKTYLLCRSDRHQHFLQHLAGGLFEFLF